MAGEFAPWLPLAARRQACSNLESMQGVRFISVHHRLGGMTGHRYAEARALMTMVPRRGAEFVLLVNESACAEVRAELPIARPVLHCPVFRNDLSFDEKTSDFVAMLHRHLDPMIRKNDWVLVTTSTQCETRALARWLAETPANRRPWALALFHSDRWNRHGLQERARQAGEFRTTAVEIAQMETEAAHRLIVGSVTQELCDELTSLLGATVHRAPQVMPSDGYVAPVEKRGSPLVVGSMGGARMEKGSHRIRRIVEESRKLDCLAFVIQLANEDLPAPTYDDLCQVAKEPLVEAVHGPLDQAAYRSLFARSDIILMPYERVPYAKRASGIFIEATLIGRPVVVPAGSWMGARVMAGEAAGAVYEGDEPGEIAKALGRVAARFPNFAERAKQLAPQWESTMTLEVFLDWLQEEISRRSEIDD